MSLVLHFHPLASFCHKVLIGLYENDTPFTGHVVDLQDPGASAEFFSLWPVGKMPVLRDEARDRTIPETTIILEYLDSNYPGPRPLLPAGETARLEARLWDRFYDLYVHAPMQKIVADELRPANEKDPRGVSDARENLHVAYGMIERQMAKSEWAAGEHFSIADCAAAPALFYAAILEPFPASSTQLAAYFERLMRRPSVVRTIAEARPYFHMFPFRDLVPERFLQEQPA